MEVMHIKVILLDKTFIKFFTKWAKSVILLIVIIFWYFNELIFHRLNFILFWRVFRRYVLVSFWFDRFLIVISIISLSTVHLLLNRFYYLRTDIFQEWLNTLITNLLGYCTNCVDSWCSDVIIFVINIFYNISQQICIVSSQLILTYNFTDHFESSSQDFRRFLPFVTHWKTFITNILICELINREVTINGLWNINNLLICMSKIIAYFFQDVLGSRKVIRIDPWFHLFHKSVEKL